MAQLVSIVDKLLTQVSIGYFPEQMGFISEKCLPQLPVVQSTGLMGKYLNEHLRIVNRSVGGRGEAPRVTTVKRDKTTTYVITSFALEDIVTPDDYRNVELPFKAEEDATLGLTTDIFVGKENDLATLLTSTGTMTQNTTLSGTSQFSDYSNSDPIGQFKTGRLAVRNGCGVPPNAAIMDWQVAETLRYHPQIWDRLGFKYNQVGELSDAQLAQALGVNKLLIAKPLYNNAVEGQSDNLTPLWGKNIIFAVLPDKATVRQVSLGYYMYYGADGIRKVYKYPIYNPAESTGIQVKDSYQFNITNANAGYLIAGAIA